MAKKTKTPSLEIFLESDTAQDSDRAKVAPLPHVNTSQHTPTPPFPCGTLRARTLAFLSQILLSRALARHTDTRPRAPGPPNGARVLHPALRGGGLGDLLRPRPAGHRGAAGQGGRGQTLLRVGVGCADGRACLAEGKAVRLRLE